MKTLFKVWNILMIIGAILSLLLLVLAIAGAGTLGSLASPAVGGATTLIAVIASLPSAAAAIISFIAAKAGLDSDYEKCAKFGMIILIVDVVCLVIAIASGNSVGSSILSTVFAGIYVYLAKSL